MERVRTLHSTVWDLKLKWTSFEQSFGIVAACIPPLRPGYIWLRSKLRVAKRSTTDHLPLTDRLPTGKSSAEAINRPPDIYSVEVDHCVPTNTEGSLSTLEGGQIRKTTRVDVEQGSKVDGKCPARALSLMLPEMMKLTFDTVLLSLVGLSDRGKSLGAKCLRLLSTWIFKEGGSVI